MGLQKDMALEYVRLFGDRPTLALARELYADNPSLYSNLEAARTAIRRARGASGKDRRAIYERSGDDGGFREPQVPGSPFPPLPEPVDKGLGTNPHVDVEAERVLLLADIQIPYHDNVALEQALSYGEAREPDCVILNGDVADCFAQSKFERDPREVNFPREREAVNQFLRHLRERYRDARIIWKMGNHEERYERYMRLKAPELLGVQAFTFANVFGTDALGVELVDRMRHIKLGRLNVVHGHEWGGGGSGGVNPARWLYLRANATAICGHFHRYSSHAETDMDGHTTSTWSTGCLCGLWPDYARYNKWSHGFAYIELDGRNFRLENLKIIEGAVY